MPTTCLTSHGYTNIVIVCIVYMLFEIRNDYSIL